MERTGEDVTGLLRAWNAGDRDALKRLMPLVYDQLHRAASRYLSRESPGHLLQSTALVNEVYLRLVDVNRITWQGRAHFLGLCAQLMRQILVDLARAGAYQKRGGNAEHVPLDKDHVFASSHPDRNLLALNDALRSLAAVDERKARTVELRFFGGLNVRETAEVLRVSPETVQRDWKFAKSWLCRELTSGRSDG